MCTKLMHSFLHFFTIPSQFVYKKRGRQLSQLPALTHLSAIPAAQPDACHKTNETCGQGPPGLRIAKKRHHNHLLPRLKDRPIRPATARLSTTIVCPTKFIEQNQPHARTKIFHTVHTSSIIISPPAQSDLILRCNRTISCSRQDLATATNTRRRTHRASRAQTVQAPSNAALTD